jgi:hypothetical protein
VTNERLREFFDEQQDIWHDVSARWVELRKLDRSPHEDHPAATSGNR